MLLIAAAVNHLRKFHHRR